MNRFRAIAVLIAIAVFASAFVARSAVADPTPLGRVDRVMADFSAEMWNTELDPPPVLAGVAHVQVHAYDVDTAPFVDPFAQTGDIGWTSCDPVLSSQCSVFPNGGERTTIRRLSFFSPEKNAVIAMNNSLFLWLIDRGAPGNEALAPGIGNIADSPTRDQVAIYSGRPRILEVGRLLEGNITIHRY